MDKIILSEIKPYKSKTESYRIVRGKTNKNGLVDLNGKLIIDFRFSIFEEFNDDIAFVSIGQVNSYTYGFLLKDVLIRWIDNPDPRVYPDFGYIYWVDKPYTKVYPYSEGFSLVNIFYNYDRQMYGFIDIYGNEKIPVIYYGAKSFHSGLAAVCNEKSLWGFIDKNGKQTIPFKYNHVDVFSENLAVIGVEYKQYEYTQYKYGYINKEGIEIIPIKYNDATSFSDGLAAVSKKSDDGSINFGYLNNKGEEVIPFIFNDAKPFSEGVAAVSTNYGNYFFINKFGNKLSSEFELGLDGSISPFKYGFARINSGNFESEELGIIKKNGDFLIQPIYSSLWREVDRFFATYYNSHNGNQESYIFDLKGNRLNEYYYNEIFSFVEGYAIVANYELIDYFHPQYGFIDKKGQELIPCAYEDIIEYRDGFAAIKQNGKWMFIDIDGQIISSKFDDICLFDNQGIIYSTVQYFKLLDTSPQFFPEKLKFYIENIGFNLERNRYGIIDIQGNEITPCIYEKLEPSGISKNQRLIKYKRNGKYGFVNTNGKEICEPIYSEILNFSEGLAACRKDYQWGFINEFGEVKIPFKYFDVRSFSCGLAAVNIDNLWGYIDKPNSLVIKPKFRLANDFFVDDKGKYIAEVQKWDGKSRTNDGYFIDVYGNILDKIF